MGHFPGGSAWAMVRDIAEGYYLVTERSFRAFGPPELDRVQFELDRRLRDTRGEQPDLADLAAIQLRNRRLQRLQSATVILQAYRARLKR
jgi:hypothetical protein